MWYELRLLVLCYLHCVTHSLVTEGNALQIQPRQLSFGRHSIYFEEYLPPNKRLASEKIVVLLNGFGVGAFHQHRLINELGESRDTAIYAMDYLGQGQSWPTNCNDGQSPNEEGLQYSGKTWVDQIICLLEHLKTEGDRPVHLVGNSVGGYLAVMVGAMRPDLVRSVVLLNATPVWGLNLPGWSGHLPAPQPCKQIGRFLFDQIRNPDTIQKYLEAAYFNEDAFDDTLVQQIRACTEGKGGHAAFASILWSPPVELSNATNDPKASFYEALTRLQCNVLLCFGANDPWCIPPFARKMLEILEERQLDATVSARYVEMSKVGHCPNHEAPRATGQILQQWLDHQVSGKPLELESMEIEERWGATKLTAKTADEISVSLLDRIAVQML